MRGNYLENVFVWEMLCLVGACWARESDAVNKMATLLVWTKDIASVIYLFFP